jgi:hypothetical protein
MNVGENWKCPYCDHAQVIAEERYDARMESLYVHDWVEGECGYNVEAIVCANAECRKLSVEFAIVRPGKDEVAGVFQHWRLLPSSFAKPLPDYIPEPLRRDYEEACAIRDLSPKASATLIRRCIQGIIRDFCGITEKRLIDEINKLRQQVDAGHAPAGVQADTVDAIDHVRQIGNIGAHMEADINVIIDVDPNEAQTLINLAELLFDEWHTAREQRGQRLRKLGIIATEKKELQQRK